MAQLQVTILEGKNFEKKDLLTESDPFIEIYLDDKNHKQKTKVIQNSKDPQWNQTFTFNHLHGQDTLHIDAYDKDLFKKDIIGLLKIDLQDLYVKGHIDNWYNLLYPSHVASQGQIHLILDYKELHV